MKDSATKPAVISLMHTCPFCPAQWEGRTADDRPLYIKGRHGFLSVRIGPPGGSVSDAVLGENELARIPHEEADTLSLDDIRLLLADTVDFSSLGAVEPFDEWRRYS